MSQARTTRSLTPPTEVQRLTNPNTSAYKHTILRRYSSAKELGERFSSSLRPRSPGSPPVTVRIDFCCRSQADLALGSQPTAEQPAMFPNFFHPTKTADNIPQERSEAAGDFSDTPLPNLRPSMADMSLKKPEKDVASSISSTRSSTFRHALLKTSSGRPMVVDRDLPVPPVLSRQVSKNHLLGIQEDRVGYENRLKVAIPSRKYSPIQMQDNPPMSVDTHLVESKANIDPSFPREPVCVDPLIHPDQSHAKAHHHGLLKGADFCDTGVPGQPTVQLPDEASSSSSSSSSASSKAEVIHAKVRRAMTGDDLCLSTVDITVPKHGGHSHATKNKNNNYLS
ncbi:polyamine transport protein [Colletotrichum tofieldiae]|nr:polyamine transport protein [Colletotrichum tofieldiae]